ncbi:MFS transporter [Streptomyces sp. NPDC056222]|uniref:MFS transporter n=1 Tax=Streptomyces sp. NPDC056222 TaxID=3345749 RepID=UPI0035D5960D
MIVGLDATILTVALPTLATELKATTTELQWFTDGYTLPFAGPLLPLGVLGVLGDRIGRRLVLIGGLLLFGVGSLMVLGVDSPDGLIVACIVMGAGPAAITPLALSIVPLMFPKEERSKAMAIATADWCCWDCCSCGCARLPARWWTLGSSATPATPGRASRFPR